MPVKEILRGVIFCHRIADDKDFTVTVNCIPDTRMKDLEEGLKNRRESGLIDTVHIGRGRFEATMHTPYEDGVDKFFAKIDNIQSNTPTFIGFDDVEETNPAM